MTTALIADDEPLLRDALSSQLNSVWPELDIVAQARNGREALELYSQYKPDICFLDIQMPGVSGLDAARKIGRDAHIVFVTAFDHFAVEAFEAGILDYLVKPVETARLLETAKRLQDRIAAAEHAINSQSLIDTLNKKLQRSKTADYLSWIHVRVGSKIRVIAVEDIAYFQSEGKYTRLLWRNETGAYSEGLIRSPLKSLIQQLDPKSFQPTHRSVIINLAYISHVERGENDTGKLYLKGRKDILPISRANINRFRATP